MEKCQEVVLKTAQELAPAANQAFAFFGQGLKDWLTAPHQERVQAYTDNLLLTGAGVVNFIVPQLSQQAEQLSTQISQACVRLKMSAPETLVTPPTYVTAGFIKAQQQVLESIQSYTSTPESPPDFTLITQQIQIDQEQVGKAANQLVMLNARHGQLPSGTISKPQDLLSAVPEVREKIIQVLAEETQRLIPQIEREVTQSWQATLLAQAKLALDEMKFKVELDLEQGIITASDPEYQGGQLEVRVSSQANEFKYDLKGYKAKDCKGPEKKFLEALRQYAGDAFVDGITHYEHETEPTRVVTPRKTKPVDSKSQKSGPKTPRIRN
jgi:hypothetical protein